MTRRSAAEPAASLQEPFTSVSAQQLPSSMLPQIHRHCSSFRKSPRVLSWSFFACWCVLQCSTSIQWNRRTIWREAMELVRPGGDGHLRNASILVLVLLLIPLFSLCFPLRLWFQRMCCLELATFRGMLDEIEKCFYVLRD
jgi:hypothetical protein